MIVSRPRLERREADNARRHAARNPPPLTTEQVQQNRADLFREFRELQLKPLDVKVTAKTQWGTR